LKRVSQPEEASKLPSSSSVSKKYFACLAQTAPVIAVNR
jgi:hypothetical protein